MSQTSEKFETVLEDLGFSSGEVAVYRALLEHGPQPVGALSAKAAVHRVNLYDILKRLIAKGVVTIVLSGKAKRYNALPPSAILAAQRNRLEELSKSLPEFDEEFSQGKSDFSSEFFIGRKAVKAAIDEVPDSKSEVLLFAAGWGFAAHYPVYFKIWHGKMIKNRVRIRALLTKQFEKNYSKPLEVAVLPTSMNFPTTTFLYDARILIVNWRGREPVAMRVRSPEIYESYKTYFEMLWKFARKVG